MDFDSNESPHGLVSCQQTYTVKIYAVFASSNPSYRTPFRSFDEVNALNALQNLRYAHSPSHNTL